jgi:AraC-like DNA-binding protein
MKEIMTPMEKMDQTTNILAIDCCEDIVEALDGAINSDMTVYDSRENQHFPNHEVDLIAVGVSNIPVRRLFISRLRRFYPDVPILILRREIQNVDEDGEDGNERIRGEFLLSDTKSENDLGLVRSAREILPLPPCSHTSHEQNFELVREVTRIMSENYADPDLNLNRIADQVPTSASRLSRILNKQVGISFRQLLKQIRIEEAKRMLASHKYSVKEVAARVGFNDSHYFSRSFKEMTGLNATEYQHSLSDMVLN